IANGVGGGIYSLSQTGYGDSAITNSTFTGNGADAGSGVEAVTQKGSNPTSMRITNSTFRRNNASLINSRGAIHLTFGTLYVTGTTVSDNENYGIAAAPETNVTIADSTISGNTLGGIEIENSATTTGRLDVTNSTIAGNKGGAGISF